LYLRNCNIDGAKIIPNAIKTKGKPNKVKKFGAPLDDAPHIQKMAKPKKTNPKGIENKPGSTNAFLTGLPLQITFSFASNSLSNIDKKFASYLNTGRHLPTH
jgi:hypothetical protein